MKILMKSPSAFLPVAMSLAALATLLVHVALFGVARQADEGTAAHIWQILMAGQLPIMAFFVIKWLPRTSSIGFHTMSSPDTVHTSSGMPTIQPSQMCQRRKRERTAPIDLAF